MRHAYAVTNLAPTTGTSYTWQGAGNNPANISRLWDGRIDRRFTENLRSGGTYLQIDFGTATALSAIAILNSNIGTVSSTVAIHAADDAAFTINAVVVKAASLPNQVAPRSKDHVFQFPSVSKRYWRIVFTWTGSFNLSVGEVFCAQLSVISRAVVYGNSHRLMIRRTEFESGSGEKRGHFIGGPIRVRELPFEELSEGALAELRSMWLNSFGGTRPLLWVERYNPTATAAGNDEQDCIFGVLEESDFGWAESDFSILTPTGLTLRSLGREVGA